MPPSFIVQHAVESFWRVDGSERPTADPVRVLPDGHMDLLVRFRRDGSQEPVVLVSGTAVAPAFAEIDPGVVYVGARFHAGAAPEVLGVRAEAAARLAAPPEALGSWVPRDLGRRVADDPDQALAVLVRSVGDLVQSASAPPPRVRAALAALASGVGVSHAADAVGVTERTLRRDVVRATGLPPGLYARVARFHRAIPLLRASGRGDLARIAYEVGYADQAHLSRDVREFSGLTPSALSRGR